MLIDIYYVIIKRGEGFAYFNIPIKHPSLFLVMETELVELQTTHLEAGNPHSAANRLRKLLKLGDLQTRLRLAENEASPIDVLKKLAKDSNPEVRAYVANNPSITHGVLTSLSADAHDDVRFAMASNPHLCLAILQKLSDDQNPYISDRAQKTIDGLALELDLEALGFVSLPGANARLGDLLVATGLIETKEIERTVFLAKGLKIPLGRALVQTGRINRIIIVQALKLQTLVRLGQMSVDKAIETLKDYINRKQNDA